MTAVVTSEVIERIELALISAKGIAWDGCHKIYILLDDEQMRLMEEYGYDPLIPITNNQERHEAVLTLVDWFGRSCGLRFISAVHTDEKDPNAGFFHVIRQFEIEREEEDA
jgi:hypothetical protein